MGRESALAGLVPALIILLSATCLIAVHSAHGPPITLVEVRRSAWAVKYYSSRAELRRAAAALLTTVQR
jgi:hypothetical protein